MWMIHWSDFVFFVTNNGISSDHSPRSLWDTKTHPSYTRKQQNNISYSTLSSKYISSLLHCERSILTISLSLNSDLNVWFFDDPRESISTVEKWNWRSPSFRTNQNKSKHNKGQLVHIYILLINVWFWVERTFFTYHSELVSLYYHNPMYQRWKIHCIEWP